MSVIYLVRHAHADWTPDEHRPLSAQGHTDAERVADMLQPFPITAIYTSPARRARQTVEPLAAGLGLPIHEMYDLRERQLGNRAVEHFFEAVKATWADASLAFPGGESNVAAQERGITVIRKLLARHPTEHLVVATHGNLLALMLQHFDASVDVAFWQSLTMPDVYRLSVSADGTVAPRRLWDQPFRPYDLPYVLIRKSDDLCNACANSLVLQVLLAQAVAM